MSSWIGRREIVHDVHTREIDLATRLPLDTPALDLSTQFGQAARFGLGEIGDYGQRGLRGIGATVGHGECAVTHLHVQNQWPTGVEHFDATSGPVVDPVVVALRRVSSRTLSFCPMPGRGKLGARPRGC